MLELEHEFRVVDVHTRFEPDPERRPRDAPDPDGLEREMHQAGIVRSLVFPAAREDGYLAANNAVARLCVDRSLVPIARLDGARRPGDGPLDRVVNAGRRVTGGGTTPEDVEQYAYDDRFEGFKLDPGVDGLPAPAVLDRLEAVGLPVIVHGGRRFPPDRIAATLLDRSMPVIVAHFGGYPLDDALTHEAIDLLGSYDDCYLDTSFVRFRDPLERAIMEHPGQILFGSGAPVAHPNVAIMEILTLDVPEDAMRRVFSTNPGRVFDSLAP